MRDRRWIAAAAVLAIVGTAAWTGNRSRSAPRASSTQPGALRSATTSRAGLVATVADMHARLEDDAGDGAAAVALADALLRQARVLGDARLAVRAEQALRRAAAADGTNYDIKRMLATVLLSQHRFGEAIAEAEEARELRPDDAWNDGVRGDALLELGQYDEAFDAFDRMMARRPSAAAYARVSYARELQGDLDGAVRLMEMALDATSAADPEAQAWHEAHLGHLAFERGRLAEARHRFQRAEFAFPDHPLAGEGLMRVFVAEGRPADAFALGIHHFAIVSSAGIAAQLGDLALTLGHGGAEGYYAEAERLWRGEPVARSRFLADRDRNIPLAVELATRAAATRRDIMTDDALAWALYKAGRIPDALEAARRALRTGTRDRQITAHAAAIHEAAGDWAAARRLSERVFADRPNLDPAGAGRLSVRRDTQSSDSNPAHNDGKD